MLYRLLQTQMKAAHNESTDISHRVERLDNLVAEKQAHFGSVAVPTAPIASLPNEILAEIFEAGYLLPRSASPERPYEIVVSQVTRRWRDVATRTPLLWTEVHILPMPAFDLVSLYLARSKSLPIDLRITSADSAGLITGRILRMISAHADRWRSLWAHCSSFVALTNLLDGLRLSTASLLEHLRFSCDDYGIEYSEEKSGCRREIMTGGTPSLKRIQLKGFGLHRCLPHLALVTTIHIHSVQSGTCPLYETLRNLIIGLSTLCSTEISLRKLIWA
jgi:hypothetical protein